MICKNCEQEREFLDDGICLICKRIDKYGIESKEFINKKVKGKEVKSRLGKKEDNTWMDN